MNKMETSPVVPLGSFQSRFVPVCCTRLHIAHVGKRSELPGLGSGVRIIVITPQGVSETTRRPRH